MDPETFETLEALETLEREACAWAASGLEGGCASARSVGSYISGFDIGHGGALEGGTGRGTAGNLWSSRVEPRRT